MILPTIILLVAGYEQLHRPRWAWYCEGIAILLGAVLPELLKIDGYVHSAPGFRGQPKVLNGASELINEVFGDRGKHARLAVGISEMPLDAAVQLSMTAEISD